MSNPLALATWPPLAIVLSAGSVTLTRTVKLDCVLGTLVWSIVICLWHALPGGLVGVGVAVAVAVAVGVAVGVGVGGGGVGVRVGVGVGVGVALGVGVGVGVTVAVGVGVADGVAVGVGVGVTDEHDSLPMVMNVPGLF